MILLNDTIDLFADAGLELIRKPGCAFYQLKLNNFKVEITPRKLKNQQYCFIRTAFGETSERIADLITKLDDTWSAKPRFIDSMLFNNADDVLSAFCDLQDAFGEEHGLGRRDIRPDVAKITAKPSIEQLATIMYNLVEAGVPFGNLLSRYGFDDRDGEITAGESYLYKDSDEPYREHAVPCMMLTQIALEMLLDGASISDVADFLNRNLKIVLITTSEAKLLDSVHKTTMPADWADGDDPYARFDAAHINIFLYE